MDRCEQCGFRYDSVPRTEIPARLTAFGGRYRAAFDRRYRAAFDRRYRAAFSASADQLRRRPAAGVWSPLEYACHVRDVFRVQRDRLALALSVDEPTFEPMRRDERAVEERYNDQDPADVLDELGAGAEALADAFAALTPEQWLRTGGYVWPDPEIHTMEWVAVHTVHEGEHHLLDIERGLRTQHH